MYSKSVWICVTTNSNTKSIETIFDSVIFSSQLNKNSPEISMCFTFFYKARDRSKKNSSKHSTPTSHGLILFILRFFILQISCFKILSRARLLTARLTSTYTIQKWFVIQTELKKKSGIVLYFYCFSLMIL